jgi:hypothetical protein
MKKNEGCGSSIRFFIEYKDNQFTTFVLHTFFYIYSSQSLSWIGAENLISEYLGVPSAKS